MSTLQETSENLLSFCGDKRYSTIYADPPWRFQNRTGKVAPENKKLTRYETMSLEDIMALPVEQVAAAKSHLYLWVPNALLPDGLAVMKAWGFEYKGNIIWEKVRKDGGPDGRGVGIKEVLRTEPEKFFYYNNGVKLLCRKITRKAAHSTDRITGLFALEGVSLVNGAQTTGSIGAVYADMPDVVARAKVFIQMIDLADTEEEQATQITRFTNTQNRIDGKDFAALDPEQERIKNELSFSGIQYLYKTGATIEDPLHQITLDEAIIAQACSIDELSIVALAKRNVGALTENINKTPYKLLFNGGTNSFSLTNNVWIARVVDSFLAQNESSATGRKRLVLVHGNRFLLHMILSEMKQYANYLTAFFDAKSLPELVNPLCQKYWELTFSAMEEKYPDAYPAHIFKNIGRLREIKEQICLRDSKSQEE